MQRDWTRLEQLEHEHPQLAAEFREAAQRLSDLETRPRSSGGTSRRRAIEPGID